MHVFAHACKHVHTAWMNAHVAECEATVLRMLSCVWGGVCRGVFACVCVAFPSWHPVGIGSIPAGS